MKFVGVLAAVLVIVTGCADTAATPRPGTLSPGTATLSVDGKELGTTYSVRCESIDWMTRIHTDGLDAMLSRADTLQADFVRLHDVAGFTGSYEQHVQGEAAVTMTGPTYHIQGAALGFNKSEPIQVRAETFTITVSC